MSRNFIKVLNKVFYDIEADVYDERHKEVFKENMPWWDKIASKYIVQSAEADFRMLDIGSGTGLIGEGILKYLDSNARFICYDLSNIMLKKSKQKLNKLSNCKLDFINGDADYLPFKECSLNVVAMNSFVHHLPDNLPLFLEIDRVLKKGGYLIMAHEPNKLFFHSLLTRLAVSFYKLIKPTGSHIDDYMHKAINCELKRNGIIKNDLSKIRILKDVEFNSPADQSRFLVKMEKGLIPHEIISKFFPDYKLIELREYSTITLLQTGNSVINYLIKKGLRFMFGKRGFLFSLVLQK